MKVPTCTATTSSIADVLNSADSEQPINPQPQVVPDVLPSPRQPFEQELLELKEMHRSLRSLINENNKLKRSADLAPNSTEEIQSESIVTPTSDLTRSQEIEKTIQSLRTEIKEKKAVLIDHLKGLESTIYSEIERLRNDLGINYRQRKQTLNSDQALVKLEIIKEQILSDWRAQESKWNVIRNLLHGVSNELSYEPISYEVLKELNILTMPFKIKQHTISEINDLNELPFDLLMDETNGINGEDSQIFNLLTVFIEQPTLPSGFTVAFQVGSVMTDLYICFDPETDEPPMIFFILDSSCCQPTIEYGAETTIKNLFPNFSDQQIRILGNDTMRTDT